MESLLDRHVLVLNRLWQAVNVCSVRRAFTLLYQEHAHVVWRDEDNNYLTHDFSSWHDFSQREPAADMVHAVRFNIRTPTVVVLRLFDRLPSKEVKFTRQNIYERDNHTCQYCARRLDRQELNLDHVMPRQRGGLTSWENVVCSCIPCNTRKGNRLPHEANMRLLKEPKRPRWRPFIHLTYSSAVHDSWRHFVDVGCWNVELGD
jgi:5-methylcytosine-specific restriction endonuclease McrA